jgi:hypothetical protein
MESKKDITLTPISNSNHVDAEKLIPLWKGAILETINRLQHLKPRMLKKLVFRPVPRGGYDGSHMTFPLYHWDTEIQKEVERIAQEHGQEFLDYLWGCGKPMLPKALPNYDRAKWNQYVISQLIFTPIMNIFQDNAIVELVRVGQFKLWAITQEQIVDYVSKASSALINNKVIIKVYCPLMGTTLEGLSSAKLSEHMYLKTYTPEERCRFFSKYSDDFALWDGLNIPLTCDSIVEIEYNFDIDVSKNEVVGSISNDLDLTKLAIFISNNQAEPTEEGTCIIEIIGRGFLDIEHRIKRQNARRIWHGDNSGIKTSGWPNTKILEKDLPRLVSIISVLAKQSHTHDEIQDSIWHFGRACLVSLPRDILLESIIGLDGILVPTSADSTYRFRLHGAALLANERETASDLFDSLGKLYNKRSKVAHGASRDESFESAMKARTYLSRAIFNIANLCEKRELPCKDKSGNILRMSQSLEELIIKKSPLINDR